MCVCVRVRVRACVPVCVRTCVYMHLCDLCVLYPTRADERRRYIGIKTTNLTFTMLAGDIMIFNYVAMATPSCFVFLSGSGGSTWAPRRSDAAQHKEDALRQEAGMS